MRDEQANRRLKKLLDRADAAFERAASVRERQLLRAYRRALDDVQAELSKVLSGTSDARLTRGARLLEIERRISGIIRSLTGVAVKITRDSTREAFLKSYNGTGKALEIASGIGLDFTRPSKAAIDKAITDDIWLQAMRGWNGKLLSDTRRELEIALRTNAREEVISGLVEGKPYAKVAKAIKERFDVTASRAKLITFTETHKAHSKGRLEGIKTAGKAADEIGLKLYKVWKHNHVGEPRPEHLAADGQKVAPDEMFNVGGEMLEGPGLGSDPANNISCHCSAQSILEGLDRRAA